MINELKIVVSNLQPWEVWSAIAFALGLCAGKVITWWDAISAFLGL